MKRQLASILFTSGIILFNPIFLSATNAAPPSYITGNAGFMGWYNDLVSSIAKDKRYHRIPLDTDIQADEFIVKLYELYTRDIDNVDFMSWVNRHYPGHEYEQIFIVNDLQMHKH